MDVRERDGTGWDELPGGLSFSSADDDDEAVEAPRRRGLRVAAWVLVLGVLLGAGGAWGARWLADADVRSVLASSTATYASVLEQLGSAPDAQALASVARDAPAAAERLAGDLARLESRSGERRGAVAGQVEAERDVLLAVGALGSLDAAPLRVWGQAHDELTEAAAAEQASRAALLVVEPAAARRLPDTPAVLRSIGTTVGEAVVGDVAQAAADVLGELGDARRTADLRATAERADAQRAAVTAAGSGLGGGTDAAVLAAFGDGLLAVAELRALTPADTSVWLPVRGRLQSALQVVADADGGLAAGTVRGRLPLVLEAVDRVVAAAEQAQAQWQPLHDAAVATQSADAEALRLHAARVRDAAADWPAVRAAVERLARPGAGPQELDAAWVAADAVRRALADAAPPAPVAAAHGALLQAADDVALPLQQVREQAAVPPVSVTALLAAWDPALAAWEAAVTAAEAEVAGRALPPPPDA